MSLLKTLGLPPTQAMNSGTSAQRPPLVDPDAQKLRTAIALQRQKASAMLARLNGVAPALEQKIAAANGDAKNKLAAARAEFEKKKTEAVHAIEQADADLEALGNPATRREELVTILARQRSGVSRATEVEIETAGLKTPTARNHDVTTTTTSYANGKAVVDKVRDQRHVGPAGSTSTQSHETEVRNDKLAVKTGDEKTSHVSVTGKASVETTKSVEVELADGRKAGAVRTDAKEISAKGASHTQTTTTANLDGSSTSTAHAKSVERGEGKVTAKTASSTTATSALGRQVKRETSASGGMIAGKDGLGAHAAVEKGKTVTTKSGRQAGVVAGLHANVVCKIGDPSGDPLRYPVTVTVAFGASGGVSAGSGKKEGSKVSLGVEAKGSVGGVMTETHMLDEGELEAYVQALKDASRKGGKAAATHKEFAIISAGVNEGWDAARRLWQSGGQALSKESVDNLKHAGDSIEVATTKTGEIGASAKVGPVGGGYSVSESDQRSTKATRNDKGALDVDAKSSHTRQDKASGSLSVGVMGAHVGSVTTHQTSFGYAITIDPRNDPDGKLLTELGTCKTELEYETFIAGYSKRIAVTGRMKGKSDAHASETGVSVMGKDVLKMGTHRGVDEQTTTDGKGKLVKKTVAGHAGAGGSLGPLSDSADDDAVAEIDGDGNATLTMTHTTTDNHNKRARAKRLEKAQQKIGLAKKEGPGTGALASAAGGEEDDSATHDVSGLTLTTKDLKRLGGVACRSLPAWMGACRRWQENDDWRAAGVAIAKAKGAAAAVAEQVARFIGGDEVERRKTVDLFIRGGHNPVKMGKGFEFPDALRALQADYDMVTADSLPDTLDAMANKSAPKAVEECKRLAAIADSLEGKIRACNDFDNKATKVEMLQRLERRRQQLVEGVKGYAGQSHPENDPKLLNEKRERLIKQCATFNAEQMRLQSELAGLLGSDKYFLGVDRGQAGEWIRQLEQLQQRWFGDFWMLKDTMAKLGVPNFAPAMLMPNEAILQFYEKAVGN